MIKVMRHDEIFGTDQISISMARKYTMCPMKDLHSIKLNGEVTFLSKNNKNYAIVDRKFMSIYNISFRP
jgi:hypothetical protein